MTYLKGVWVIAGTAMDAPGQFCGFITVQAEGDDGTVLEGQLSIDETRVMALNFLSVAEAARQDSLIFRLLTRDAGFDPDQAAAFVRKMRDEREATRDEETPQ